MAPSKACRRVRSCHYPPTAWSTIGDIVSFTRDDPDGFGSWYHGHLKVSTPSGVWDSALDVATPSGLGVRYRVSYGLDLGKLGPVASLATGFHLIASTPTSGAIDYIRSPFLQDYLLTAKRMATIGMPKIPVPLPPPPSPGPPVEGLGGPAGPIGPDGDFAPGRPRGPMTRSQIAARSSCFGSWAGSIGSSRSGFRSTSGPGS